MLRSRKRFVRVQEKEIQSRISTMRVFPVTGTRDYNTEYNLFSLLAIEHLKYNYENSAISVFIICPARGIKGCFCPSGGINYNMDSLNAHKVQSSFFLGWNEWGIFFLLQYYFIENVAFCHSPKIVDHCMNQNESWVERELGGVMSSHIPNSWAWREWGSGAHCPLPTLRAPVIWEQKRFRKTIFGQRRF